LNASVIGHIVAAYALVAVQGDPASLTVRYSTLNAGIIVDSIATNTNVAVVGSARATISYATWYASAIVRVIAAIAYITR